MGEALHYEQTYELRTTAGRFVRAGFVPQGVLSTAGTPTDFPWLDFHLDEGGHWAYLADWIVQPSLFDRYYYEFQEDGSLRFDEHEIAKADADGLLEWLDAIVNPPLKVSPRRERPSGLSA